MVMSFLPISFHCSSTACDGLGAGFGGSFFAASCAVAGNIANPRANATPANLFQFVMISLLSLPRPPGAPSPSDGPLRRSFLWLYLQYLVPVSLGEFILRSYLF